MTETNRMIPVLEPVAAGVAAARSGGDLTRSSGSPLRRLACHKNPGRSENTKAEGRRAEFAACLTPIMSTAYRVAFHLTSNGAEAEELVQDAALLAFQHFDSYQKGTDFKAWLMKILKNCFLMTWRKRKRQPQSVDLSDLPDAYLYGHVLAADLYSKTDDPARFIMDELTAEQIAEALQNLPEEYQVVSVCYFVEELSYQEISEHLDIPVGTVRSRLHRGRKMLQKLLLPLVQEGLLSESC